MGKAIFIILTVIFLCANLALAALKEPAIFGCLYIATAALSIAFYLFQFGSLKTFSISALCAKAEFISEKVNEAKEGAMRIDELRKNLELKIERINEVMKNLENLHAAELSKNGSAMADLHNLEERVKNLENK